MTMNQTLEQELSAFFKKELYDNNKDSATYEFKYNDQNYFTALMYANYINVLNDRKAFVIDEFITVKKV